MRSRLTERDRTVYHDIWTRRPVDAPSAMLQRALRSVLETVSAPHVVDLGCGAGRHTVEAARRGARVTAIDHHPSAISTVLRHGLEIDVRHEDFVQWLSAAPTHSADLVVCYDAVHPISAASDDVLACIADMLRIVVPHGLVLVTLLTDIHYADPAPPPGRLRLDEHAGAALLDRALASSRLVERQRKAVHIERAFAPRDPGGETHTQAEYRATRLLRLVEA
jgi:SAM-dependent methyltransferase